MAEKGVEEQVLAMERLRLKEQFVLKLLFFTSRYLKETPVQIENGFYTLRCIGWWNIIYKEDKSEVEGEVNYVFT